MSIFKKSDGVDVLDLTKLQKKGLLKLPEQKTEHIKVNSQGYVDLGITVLPNNSNNQVEAKKENYFDFTKNSEVKENNFGSGGASALGFLDSLASTGSTENKESNYFSSDNGSSSNSNSIASDSLEIQGLKNKIEDLEYKIRVLEDKISKMRGN